MARAKPILILLGLNSLLQFFIPFWWVIGISGFLVGFLLCVRPMHAFITGCLGISLSWLAMMLVTDATHSFALSKNMSAVLPLGGFIPGFYLLSLFIGGLIGGLSALSGYYGKKFFIDK